MSRKKITPTPPVNHPSIELIKFRIYYLVVIVTLRTLLILLFLISISSKAGSNENQLNYAIRYCQQDMQQFTASGLSTKQYLKFCECYMTKMINAMDEKEINYQKKYNKPSGKYIKLSKKYKNQCS